MNKFKNILTISFFIFIFVNIFVISDEIANSLKISCDIWFNNLIPSMLPFYIISDILVNYGFVDILAFIFNKIIYNLFGLSGNASFVIFFSMLTGFPSSAKYIKKLLDENLLTIDEANKLIRFTHFSNPLFIINVIGAIVNDKVLALFVLISHYLSNFIIAFLFRNPKIKSEAVKHQNQPKSLGEILTKSFLASFDAFLIILGSLITFKILIRILYHYNNFNDYFSLILESFLEITQGLFRLKSLNLSNNIKAIISSSIISFGGCCIHMQVCSLLSQTKIKYSSYLIGRLLQLVISPIILALILLITHRI